MERGKEPREREALDMPERLKYWIFQRGKSCSACCLRCEYYDLCSWEVKNNKKIDGVVLILGRRNGKHRFLQHICEYKTKCQENRKGAGKI